MSALTHLSLFSGIGGMDLAAEWAGFETIGQVELADYPTKVLEKHWPNVSRWRDVRDVTAESFREKTGLRDVTVISGGPPCQPFSMAGNQKGKGDDRYLWPEMLRVIRELAPRWVVCENVPGILRAAGRTICEDLEYAGYSVAVFDFEAAAVGAPHRRERVFFVAHANGEREPQQKRGVGEVGRRVGDSGETVAYAEGKLSQEGICSNEAGDAGPADGGSARPNWWAVESDMGRMAHGVPARLDRLKSLGNAVVPQQAYPIFAAIAEEEGRKND